MERIVQRVIRAPVIGLRRRFLDHVVDAGQIIVANAFHALCEFTDLRRIVADFGGRKGSAYAHVTTPIFLVVRVAARAAHLLAARVRASPPRVGCRLRGSTQVSCAATGTPGNGA